MPIGQQKASNDAAAEPMAESEPNSDEMMIMSTLTLPSNATSIRADITDNFSCENLAYGYYADVENDCQIFHVCLPVTYANGKENTFRWSFICPEETIFSQESFTCMRPEDMVISCEESFKYYDLNSNFGTIEQESEKEMNEIPTPEAIKPSVEAEPEMEVAEAEEPVKVQKPNRRRPGVSYAVQRKPSNSYPLRKISQSQTQLNSNADAQTSIIKEIVKPVEEAVEEEKIKPVVQKFSRRPVSPMSTTLKDKMQSAKPETVNAIRSDLYNQKRKRPTMFNKKTVEEEIEKTVKEPAKEETPASTPEISEQTLPQMVSEILNGNTAKNGEAETAKEESPKPAESPEQTFFQMEPEMSIDNSEAEMADATIQASENNEVLVKPQEDEAPKAVEEPAKDEESQVLEAFEEIPAVVAEVEEMAAQPDESQKTDEIPAQQTPTVEELPAGAEMPKTEENLESQELNSVQETQAAAEDQSIEETIQTAEKTQAEEVVESTGETQSVEAAQAAEELAEEPQMIHEAERNEEIPAVQEPEAASNELLTAEEPEAVEKVAQFEDNQATLETQELNAEDTKPIIESDVDAETTVGQENMASEDNESQTAEEKITDEMIPAVEESLGNEKVFSAEESLANEMVPVQVQDDVPVSVPEHPNVFEEGTKPEEADETSMAEQPEHVKSEIAAEPAPEKAVFAEPSIFEENSEENAAAAAVPVQTIEEMEEERPNEAPESMPATEEMAQQDPIVQQMLEEASDEDKKQTLGGFKPVDPIMAAEAEQLIADFINTLRKNEFVNEKPGMPMQMPAIEETVPESSEDTAAAVEETVEEANQTQAEDIKDQQPEEIPSQPQIVETQFSAEESKAQELEDDKPSSEEANVDEVPISEEVSKAEEITDNEEEPSAEPAKVEEQASSMSNIPQDILQIPVHIIATPLEEMPKQDAAAQQPNAEVMPMEMSSEIEEKPNDETPTVVMDGYKPLSIDDIVELVKERLDQMPKDKMETPMQLEQMLSEVKPQDEQLEEELPQAEVEQNQELEQPKAELVPETQQLQVEHEQEAQQPQVESNQVPQQPEIEQAQESQQSEIESAQVPQQLEEEIILPIYHRTGDIGQVDSPVPDESLQTVDNVVEPNVSQDKSGRFYRLRSMLNPKGDVRKRRFLFRSDAS